MPSTPKSFKNATVAKISITKQYNKPWKSPSKAKLEKLVHSIDNAFDKDLCKDSDKPTKKELVNMYGKWAVAKGEMHEITENLEFGKAVPFALEEE